MRLMGIVVLCVMLFAGCKTMDDYNACLADPVCHERMLSLGNSTAVAVSSGASAFPVSAPFANAVGWIGGYLASLLAGVLYGKKLRQVRKTDA